MRQATLDEAPDELAELVEAAINGEPVFITKNGQQVIQLVPTVLDKPRPRFGSAKGLITMSDNFDEPLDDFKPYME